MSCRGCQYTVLDFATVTADEDRLQDFLVVHHAVADTCFCDECHHECRVDKRRKLFRCDRQVTVKLEEGHEKTFILKELGSGNMVR